MTVIGDSKYLERFGKGTQGEGWYSFNHRGVHFIGLVNVASRAPTRGSGSSGRSNWTGSRRTWRR